MNQNKDFKISEIPRNIKPGQDVILTIHLPDTGRKYHYRWKLDGREIDTLVPTQVDREVQFCWIGTSQYGTHTLAVQVYHIERKDKRGEIVDVEKECDFEVTDNPQPSFFLDSVGGIQSELRRFNDTFTGQTGTIPERGDEQVVKVQHQKSVGVQTKNQALWVSIRNRSKAIGFGQYSLFLNRVFQQSSLSSVDGNGKCTEPLGESGYPGLPGLKELPKAFHGVDAYELLKTATQMFLLLECGVKIDETGEEGEPLYLQGEEAGRLPNVKELGIVAMKDRLVSYLGVNSGRLPYIDRIIDTVFQDEKMISSPYYGGILQSTVDCPCLLELIWSYWHEEGGLVQTLNAISRRFQNKRGAGGRDPLAQLEIAPLRPLNNLLWGYVQDERDRLSIARRASEYQHQYGFTLLGKGVPKLRPADNRSKFIEAFHTLLFRSWTYYQEVADTHVVPDGFPLLNSLKEVHMLLAEGAHNQFGDLPWTSRAEMLIQQWLLARPETQDFLRGRAMVPYKEPWMGPADTMKKLQGWTDVPVTHFRDLGVFGEQLLLSVRYDDWIDDAKTEDDAKNWANYWKQEAQGYIHSYRAATGVDLTNAASARERIDTRMPALHLRERERQQARSM